MRPRADRAVMQAAALVVDDQVRVEIQLGAEPVAGRAGAERVVEREQPRLDLRDREARDRAGEFGREDRLLAAIGANRYSLVPSGIARTRSTICDTVWLTIGSPVAGEYGTPTRAHSRRI